MLTVEKLSLSVPDKPAGDNVHPFYKDSIKCLFGVELQDDQHNSLSRNRVSLVKALQDVLTVNITGITYFFDIRLQEELGSTSPQYEILADLGMQTVMPVCIHGDGFSAVQEGFSMIGSLLNKGEKAICSVSLLSSAEWQFTGNEFIIAFLVSSDGIPDGKISMEGVIVNGK